MTIAAVAARGTGVASTSGSSFTLTPTAAIAAGRLAVLVVSSDNVATADGVTNTHTSVTSANATWTKAGEYTNGNGAAAAGVTVSVWYAVTTGSLSTAITINHGTLGDRCATLYEFSTTVGSIVLATGLGWPNNTATDASNGFGGAASPTVSVQTLIVRGLGKEANTTTALTPTGGIGAVALTNTRSRNNASAMTVYGEYVLLASGSITSVPTLAVAGDTAGVMVGFQEPVTYPVVRAETASAAETSTSAVTVAATEQAAAADTVSQQTITAFSESAAAVEAADALTAKAEYVIEQSYTQWVKSSTYGTADMAISDDGLQLAATTTETAFLPSPRTTGKLYFEFSPRTTPTGLPDSHTFGLREGGLLGTVRAYGMTAASGSAVGSSAGTFTGTRVLSTNEWGRCAVDLATGKIWFGDASSWWGDPAAGTDPVWTIGAGKTLWPRFVTSGSGPLKTGRFNFGATAFAHTIPAGFSAWDDRPIPAWDVSSATVEEAPGAYEASLTEAAAAEESSSQLTSATSAQVETGAAADAPAQTMDAPAAVSETGAASESSSSSMTAERSTVETGAASESASASITVEAIDVEAGESASLLDAPAQTTSSAASSTEAGAATEAASGSTTATAQVTEASAATDAAALTMQAESSVDDTGAAADTVDATVLVGTHPVTIEEAAPAMLATAATMAADRSISETAAAVDTISAEATPLAQTSAQGGGGGKPKRTRVELDDSDDDLFQFVGALISTGVLECL